MLDSDDDNFPEHVTEHEDTLRCGIDVAEIEIATTEMYKKNKLKDNTELL